MRGAVLLMTIMILVVALLLLLRVAEKNAGRREIEFGPVDDRYDGVFLVRDGRASLVYRYPRGDEIEQELGVRQAQALRKQLDGR
jgi:hypothetical protein